MVRVLVLAWGVGEDEPGPSPQGAGLARALAAAGHDVRLVTRQAAAPLELDGVEVHAVADAPPIVPPSLADPVLDALAFAGRATSVAVRRLEERVVDVVHAEGWPTGPVVAALQASHAVPVIAALDPDEVGGGDSTRSGLADALVTGADVHVVRAGRGTRLPVGVALPRRRPGPPPRRGPVLLAAGPAADHRTIAGRLRSALPDRPRITRSWARRPSVVAVLHPADVDTVVRGFAAGLPVVAVAGPAGSLVAAAGAGVVIDEGGVAAAAAAVDRIRADHDHAAVLGRAAAAAAADHAWPRVAAVWGDLAALATEQAGTPRLHAAP